MDSDVAEGLIVFLTIAVTESSKCTAVLWGRSDGLGRCLRGDCLPHLYPT